MSNQTVRVEEFEHLKRQVEELKKFLTEHYSNQLELNSEYRANIEVLKDRVSMLASRSGKIKLLIEKYKIQKAQMNLLVKLLQGKLNDHECVCGRRYNALSFHQSNMQAVPQGGVRNTAESAASNMPSTSYSSRFDDTISLNTPPAQYNMPPYMRQTNNAISLNTPPAQYNMPPPYMRQTNNDIRPPNQNRATMTCTYTAEQQARIGQIISRYSRFGPVECLNDRSEWLFQIADNQLDDWNQLYSRSNVDMVGRLLLLPVELAGITLQLSVKRILSGDEEEDDLVVGMAIFSRRDDDNRITLPLHIDVEADLKFCNGAVTSGRHSFAFHKVGLGYPSLDNITLSMKDCDRSELPKLSLKFSNV